MGNVPSEDEPVHDVEAEPFGFRVLSVAEGSPASTCKLIAEGERLIDDEDVAVEGELLDRARDEAEKRKRSASAAASVDGGLKIDEDASHSLIMFFDTIVAAGGVRLESEPDNFVRILAEHENKPLRLHVWNSKAAQLREIEILPRRHDGSGLLGIITEHGSYTGNAHSSLHVTDVLPLSPAERAGLVPVDDFILRAAGAEFESIADFQDFINERAGELVTLLVHSAGRDSVRELQLQLPADGEAWLGAGGAERRGIGLVVEQGLEHLLPSMGTIGRNEAPDERLSKRDRELAAAAAEQAMRGAVLEAQGGEATPSVLQEEEGSKEGQSGVQAVGNGAAEGGGARPEEGTGGGASEGERRASGVAGVAVEQEDEQDPLEESVDGDDEGREEEQEPRL